MVNARSKGNSFERSIMNRLKSYFPAIATSRNASRVLDAQKIDFVNTEPMTIQAKAVEQSINYWEYFKANPQVNTIWHKRKYYLGKHSELIVMRSEVLLGILECLKK